MQKIWAERARQGQRVSDCWWGKETIGIASRFNGWSSAWMWPQQHEGVTDCQKRPCLFLKGIHQNGQEECLCCALCKWKGGRSKLFHLGQIIRVTLAVYEELEPDHDKPFFFDEAGCHVLRMKPQRYWQDYIRVSCTID